MRDRLLLVLCLLLTAHTSAGETGSVLDNALELYGGGTLELAEKVGDKPIYLKFWASWCGTCMEQMPHLERTYREYQDDLTIISVNIWINESKPTVDATINEFGLTVPVAIDRRGTLSQGFGVLGTPYHVLIDAGGDIVHTGSDASPGLDQKIELLASDSKSGLVPIVPEPTATDTAPSILSTSEDLTLLFFTATWCDWYLEESRPMMSAACVDAQRSINQLYERQPDLEIQGLVTRLWTGEEELDEYTEKYAVPFPMSVDRSNEVFYALNVQSLPTLVVMKDGREVGRTTKLGSVEALAAFLRMQEDPGT